MPFTDIRHLAGLLSFTTYYLIKNTDAMQRAQEEVDRVIGKGPVTYQHMSKLPYIEACLREALRLWPTAAVFSIKPIPGSQSPIIIGGQYELPPDAAVAVLLPQAGRDSEVFGADVEEFRPERMFGENFARLPPNAWKVCLIHPAISRFLHSLCLHYLYTYTGWESKCAD